jgi:L-iditol 2-dehydrogenase
MKALVKTKKGEGNIEVMDMPVPIISDDEVLIKVRAAGICGTDIHILHDRVPYWPPVILGHEFSGEIVQVGSKIKKMQIGDRVVGEPHTQACGECYLCRNGYIQICREKRSPGCGIHGAFTEFIKMPEKLLHKIPENVSFEEAAVLEPCAIVSHQVIERGTVKAGEVVVVFGAGTIGVLGTQMAKISGASKVVLVGRGSDVEYRFKVADEIGSVDVFVNTEEESILDVVMDLTSGIGADLVIEASGSFQAIKNGVNVLKKRGRFTAIGLTGKDSIEFPWDTAMYKVIDLHFNMSSSYNGWNTAIKLLGDSKLKVNPLITSIEPLENWEKAFDDIQKGRALKVLLNVSDLKD